MATVCIFAAGLSFAAAGNAADALRAGALKSSPSMYLRESASSAIRWQQWSPQTLALARRLNRPLMIDISAVWCHWCHVMDQTTYADPEVAAELNRAFVPVKIDSDERPDIDGYYQNAAGALTGAGGWPLTCFTTPDGALLFAAGYLPPRPGAGPHGSGTETSSMLPLLKQIAKVYGNDRASIQREADATADKLKSAFDEAAPSAPKGLDGLRAQILAGLAASYDARAGGFESAPGPRFYDFPAIELVLAHGFYGHPDYTAMALATLRHIAAGGVFDQLGGGLHRYSTDSNWRVPHFEKLAADQAMALRAYSNAYEVSGDPELAGVARSIAGYVNRELLDPQTHAFYSHQDADSFAGDDGSYYTWTVDEVKRVLPSDQAQAAILLFGMQGDPGLAPDRRIVLRRALTPEQLAARLKIPLNDARGRIAKASAALQEARSHRKAPPVDHAIMTDRNALMADAYLTASAALDESSLQDTALAALDFVRTHLRARDGSFYHVWSDGVPHVTGLVADQVYLLNALIDAYEFSADKKYLDDARSLASVILKNFLSKDSNLLANRDTEDAHTVVAASLESSQVFFDMPTPSPQATMTIALLKLSTLTGYAGYSKIAADLMAPAPAKASSMLSTSIATVGLALEHLAHGDSTVTIAGPPSEEHTADLLKTALATFRPGKVVLRATPDSPKSIATVCAGRSCASPIDSTAKLAQTIRTFDVTSSAKTTPASGKSVVTTSP